MLSAGVVDSWGSRYDCQVFIHSHISFVELQYDSFAMYFFRLRRGYTVPRVVVDEGS